MNNKTSNNIDENLWWQHHIFHEQIAQTIVKMYKIDYKWSKTFAWGYNTTTVYMEDKKNNTYTVKLTKISKKHKEQTLLKDVLISHYINENTSVPTPRYIKNIKNEYLTPHQDLIMRVQVHIKGFNPLKMNFEVLQEATTTLKQIHNLKIPQNIKIESLLSDKNEQVLNHGDLTPQNMLVSYNKIVGILDLELALIAPPEWDLSRLAVFSGFYMKEKFEDITQQIKQTYSNNIDLVLYKEFSKLHLQKRVFDITKNENMYKDKKAWKDDLAFTSNKLAIISNVSFN